MPNSCAGHWVAGAPERCVKGEGGTGGLAFVRFV